ncbi:MAG TPA: porphobilinogen synthase [Planctomycetota bacterium]|jgi:porphobilinogen synthase|nr:porphobilinogen synthase [Planctomycetota bacterium]
MKTFLRNLRKSPGLRRLVRETELLPEDLVMPYFVRAGKAVRAPIPSMPGQYQLSIDELLRDARALVRAGVGSVILFGIPPRKDSRGSGAWARGGIVQQAVRALKDAIPDLVVITDVCLCEYTDHGHCGVLRDGDVDNDATLPLLARIAASQVEAGADVVAPSGMMDGAVAAIRRALPRTPILAYAAKYASAFYGPFRQAAESAPRFGDRAGYQMDPANAEEALREIDLDIREGADIIMVKPALAYLDVLRRAKEKFGWPTAAYNVSGEYAMIRAAGERGWIDEKKVVLEVLTSIKRSGADFILTYFAREAAEWIA